MSCVCACVCVFFDLLIVCGCFHVVVVILCFFFLSVHGHFVSIFGYHVVLFVDFF